MCAEFEQCWKSPEFNNATGITGQTQAWSNYYCGGTFICQVWVNVQGPDCLLSSATQIGVLNINETTVEWDLAAGWVSDDFALYSGPCVGSDNGSFLNTKVCEPPKIAQFADNIESYTLRAKLPQKISRFFFDATNEDLYNNPSGAWPVAYDVFPIGRINPVNITADRQYMTAYANVCPTPP
jgi:hypothetical protein